MRSRAQVTVQLRLAVAAGVLIAVAAPGVTIASASGKTGIAAPASPPSVGSIAYSYSGSAASFGVPDNVDGILVDAYGAHGGAGYSSPGNGVGGNGGEVTASIPVTAHADLEVNVGGVGGDGSSSVIGSGGYNGGGDGSLTVDTEGAGGGGGATDLRAGSCAINLVCTADDRVVVGGGGGGGAGGGGYSAPGGDGGGSSGTDGGGEDDGTTGGGGATQNGVGAAGSGDEGTGNPGSGSSGGEGVNGGGGGGGGWFGGGGGGESSGENGSGGGGGSGYIGADSFTSGTTTASPELDIYWMTASAESGTVGQPITLTAYYPVGAPGAVVDFASGAHILCSDVAVGVDNTAECTESSLGAGTRHVVATYSAASGGDPLAGGLTESHLVTIQRHAQHIKFHAPGVVLLETSATLHATATSGLPVKMKVDPSSTPGTCRVKSKKVRYVRTGLCVLDANQAGNASYSPATQVQRGIEVGLKVSRFIAPKRGVALSRHKAVIPVAFVLRDGVDPLTNKEGKRFAARHEVLVQLFGEGFSIENAGCSWRSGQFHCRLKTPADASTNAQADYRIYVQERLAKSLPPLTAPGKANPQPISFK